MRDAFGQALVELGRQYPRMIVLDADLNTSSKAAYVQEGLSRPVHPGRHRRAEPVRHRGRTGADGLHPVPVHLRRLRDPPGARPDRHLDLLPQPEREDPRLVRRAAHQPGRRLAQLHRGHRRDARVAQHARRRPGRQRRPARRSCGRRSETDGPVYFRVTRLTLPTICSAPDHRFEWGKGVHRCAPGKRCHAVRHRHDDLASASKAADLLAAEGIEAEVVHLASIKPIDRELIVAVGRADRLRGHGRERHHHRRLWRGGRRGAGRGRARCPCSGSACATAGSTAAASSELFTHHGMQPDGHRRGGPHGDRRQAPE